VNTLYRKGIAAAFAAFLVLCCFNASAAGLNWYVQNQGSPEWGDVSGGSQLFWELMDPSFPSSAAVSFVDLDPNNAYFAFTGMYDQMFWGTHFWAELWLANNFVPTVARRVDAELWVGTFGQPGNLLAAANTMVNNAAPAQKYVFDFGVLDVPATLANIILKITYSGPVGDTHIYWAHSSCPSGLYSNAPLSVHPSTWGRIKALYR
jgi:hypothetical protein